MPSFIFVSILVFLNTNPCSLTVFLWKPSEETCNKIKMSTCYDSSIYCHNLHPDVLSFGRALYEIRMNESDREIILEYHNTMRQEIACGAVSSNYKFPRARKMEVMVWDGELEWGAYNLAKTCSFTEDCPATESYLQAGQRRSVVAYDPQNETFSEKFKEMFHEIHKLRSRFYGDVENYSFLDGFRHFAQVVKEDSNRIGCASFVCSPEKNMSSLLYMVCNYNSDIMFKDHIYRVSKLNKSAESCIEIHKNYKCLCENYYDGSLWDRNHTKEFSGAKCTFNMFSFIYFIYLEVVLNLS